MYHRVIRNPDSPSPRQADRRLDLQDWSKEIGEQQAQKEGIELTPSHWEVIYCLQHYYLRKDYIKNARQVSDMLERVFADRGGSRYLRELFPKGPVGQGMRIAGLPLPRYLQDEDFGISY